MCAGGVLANLLILITSRYAYLPTTLPQCFLFYFIFLHFREFALSPGLLLIHNTPSHPFTHSFIHSWEDVLIAAGARRYRNACGRSGAETFTVRHIWSESVRFQY